jgi:nucleoid-associated protein YgaU
MLISRTERKDQMAQQPQQIQPGSDYTVQTGDTLWDIAQRVYNHQEDWATIYNANKQVIGDNPDLIHPGQVLHIPLQPDISIRKPPPTTLPPPVGLNNGQPSADLGQPSH